MQSMAKLGFVSTNGYDAMITDSANSAAAYASGHKQAINSLNVYADSYDTSGFKPAGFPGPYSSTTFSPAQNTASTNDDPKVETIVEMAKRKYGAAFGVGVVTTSEIQDATPAAFFAHTRRRSDKAEITRQFFEGWDTPATPPATRFSAPPAIDVLMGGGANYFAANPALPVVVPLTGVNGVATVYCQVQLVAGACPAASQSAVLADAATAAANFPLSKAFSGLSGRNFFAEAAAKYNYTVAYDRTQMYQTINTNNKLLGIFHYGNMDVWTDRHDPAGPERNINILPYASPVVPASGEALANMPKPLNQPDLAEMTDVAIRSLRNKPAGFFLMVEGASIDKQSHPMDFERTIGEMIDFDNAVGVALQHARANGDTLVLVTADHGHAYDVVGTVDRAVFNARDALTDDPAQKKLLRESAIQTYSTAGTPTYVDANGDNFPDNFGTRYGLAGGYGDVTFQKLDFQPKAQNPADNSNQNLGSAAAAAAMDVGDHFGAGNTGASSDKTGYTNGMTVGRTLAAARAWDSNTASASGAHTLQDVPVYGEGPGSAAIQTAMANTELFGLMAGALGLGGA
jgi:alkaline phosphatase